jgi:hypothetical protein
VPAWPGRLGSVTYQEVENVRWLAVRDNWDVMQMPHDGSGRTRRRRPIGTPNLPDLYTRYGTIEVTPR